MLSPHQNPKLAIPIAIGLVTLLSVAAYGLSLFTTPEPSAYFPEEYVYPTPAATPTPTPEETTLPTPVPTLPPVSFELTTSVLTGGWSKFNDTTHGVSFEYPSELTVTKSELGASFGTEVTDSLYYYIENVAFSKEAIKSPFDFELTEVKVGAFDGFTSSYGDAGCASERYYFPIGPRKLLGTLAFSTCDHDEEGVPEEKPVAANAKQRILDSVRAD